MLWFLGSGRVMRAVILEILRAVVLVGSQFGDYMLIISFRNNNFSNPFIHYGIFMFFFVKFSLFLTGVIQN